MALIVPKLFLNSISSYICYAIYFNFVLVFIFLFLFQTVCTGHTMCRFVLLQLFFLLLRCGDILSFLIAAQVAFVFNDCRYCAIAL